jgi:hypothetical protein
MKNDVVNHPSHYTDGNIEVIDFIEDKGLGFCLGNAIKYISRAGKKYPDKEIEDLEKAVWYINRRIKELKKEKDEKELKDNVCLFEGEKDKLESLGNSKDVVDGIDKLAKVVKPIRGLRAKSNIYDEVVNPTVEFSKDMPEDQICDGLFKIFHAADPEYSREQFDEDWKDVKEEAARELPTLMDFSRLFK